MSCGINNCQRRLFFLSGEISECVIDLVGGVQNINVNTGFFFRLSCELVGLLNILGFPVNIQGD